MIYWRIYILFFCGLIGARVYAAANAANADLDLKNYPSSMSFSQYESDDFNTMRRVLYDVEDGKYYPENRETTHRLGNPGCIAEYLRGQQKYPLSTMMKRLGYTAQTVEEQSQIGMSLKHEQIVFHEKVRLVPHQKWNGPYDPSEIDQVSHAIDESEALRVKTAALWTVSGQTLIHDAPFIHPEKLPWELEPDVDPETKKQFDRNKYKFVSEWGRAAQRMPGEINSLYSVAAATDYQRVKAMGGKIEDAWVVVSTNRPENVRLYDKMFPGFRFPKSQVKQEGKKDVHFLIPLAEMMKNYPPGKYLERVAKVVALSDGKLSDADALDLLNEYRVLIWDELNFQSPKGGDQKQPLLLHDFSMATYYSRFGIFERHGIPPEKIAALAHYLEGFKHIFGTPNRGQYKDASDMNFYPELSQMKAIEVSNLNGKLAKEDPQYVKAALLSTYSFYIKKYFGGKLPEPEAIQTLLHNLSEHQNTFAITTSDPEIIKQIQALHPIHQISSWMLDDPDGTPPPELVEGLGEIEGMNPGNYQITGSYKKGHSFIFSIQQISDLLSANKNFFSTYCQDAIHAGSRRAHYLLHSSNAL